MGFYFNTAEQNFYIDPNFEKIRRYCKGFICEPRGDAYDVSVTIDELEAERDGAVAAAKAENRPVDFSRALLEILAVHRKVSDRMPDHDAFLFHASAVAVDGQAYVFAAKSGTGKSTHTALWRRKFGDRAVMVNDDKPFVKIKDGATYVCGSPWSGKHKLSENVILPVKAVCLLCRGDENRIYRINEKEALPYLYEQTYRPDDPEKLAKTIALLDKLASTAGLFRLFCNMDPEAADIAYEAMEK